MKKLFLLICSMSLIFVGRTQCTQQDYVTAVGFSLNGYSHQYPGLGVEVAKLAQGRNIGGSVGISAAPIRYQAPYFEITDGKEERGIKTVNSINMNMWVEGLYKIVQKDYKHSVHLVGGGTFDDYMGVSAYGGVNVRFPTGYKAWFAQAVYRTDKVFWIRTGIYIQ